MIRVLIAGEHRLLCQGLRRLLAKHADLSVIGEAGSRAETLCAAHVCDADLVLLDLSMQGLDGFDLSDQIRELRPSIKILLLSTYSEESIILRALRVGVDGCMAKENTDDDLIAAIRRLAGRNAVASEWFFAVTP